MGSHGSLGSYGLTLGRSQSQQTQSDGDDDQEIPFSNFHGFTSGYSPRPNLRNGTSKSRNTRNVKPNEQTQLSPNMNPIGLVAYKSLAKNELQTTVPKTHELGCYVAMETSKDVADSWDAMIQAYISSLSYSIQPNESLGAHVQLLYNSTQAHFERLARLVDKTKHRRHDDLAFGPVYNFHNYEKERFYEVLQAEAHKRRCSTYDNLIPDSRLFFTYLKTEVITTLELDSIFNGRMYNLPKCIFMVKNLERLSLKDNHLKKLPADIARLQKLTCLELSYNKLKNDSIPYTLSYCKQLTTLLLDHNSLDAIPGFVLELTKLKTLYRHGNQNYFRSTFMWYGCESRERIRTASFSDVETASLALSCASQVQSLKFWAAHTIISRKANYFLIPSISEPVKDYISDVYKMFNICAACKTASLLHATGYIVFTFRNPYANNTCVPFQHWACSRECALAIEVPARRQQIVMAKKQKKAYESHIRLYSPQTATIDEHSVPPPNIMLCTICHPGRSRSGRNRKRFRCNLM